jgi:hypothetical protein
MVLIILFGGSRKWPPNNVIMGADGRRGSAPHILDQGTLNHRDAALSSALVDWFSATAFRKTLFRERASPPAPAPPRRGAVLARGRARWQTGCQMDPSGLEPPSPPRDRDDDPVAENPFGLFPAIVLVVLIVGGLLLAFRLRDVSSIQDCVWSGRKNCAPIDTAGSP